MSKSVKHLVMLAMFTTMALTIFVVEAQIPIPVPIYGVKLGLANVITLIVLVVYRPRDAFAVLVMRILLGSLFTGTLVSMIYSSAAVSSAFWEWHCCAGCCTGNISGSSA